MRLLSVFLLLSPIALAIEVVPPSDTWVLFGQSTVLTCKSSFEVNSCTWETPYNKAYTLSKGLKAEGGRIVHISNENTFECGIKITNITDMDIGKWTCNVGVVQDSEVISDTREVMLMMAEKPASVNLVTPFDKDEINISLAQKYSVGCTVSKALPRPVFTWYVGEEELVDAKTETEKEGDSWLQILHFNPAIRYNNRSLRCVIDHMALEANDTKEATTRLIMSEVPTDFSSTDPRSAVRKGGSAYPIVVCVTVTLGILIVVATIARCYFSSKINNADIMKTTDLEGGKSEDSEETLKENTEESQELSKGFINRMKTLLPVKKEESSKKKNNTQDVAAEDPNKSDNFVTVDINEDTEKEENPEESTVKEPEEEMEAKKSSGENRKFSFFLNLMKKSAASPKKCNDNAPTPDTESSTENISDDKTVEEPIQKAEENAHDSQEDTKEKPVSELTKNTNV